MNNYPKDGGVIGQRVGYAFMTIAVIAGIYRLKDDPQLLTAVMVVLVFIFGATAVLMGAMQEYLNP